MKSRFFNLLSLVLLVGFSFLFFTANAIDDGSGSAADRPCKGDGSWVQDDDKIGCFECDPGGTECLMGDYICNQ